MLPKKYRITKEEIPLVARKGTKTQFDGFYMKFINDASLLNSKFGIIIPKKVIALATKRNRVKRVFRAVLWSLIQDDKFKSIGFYVFFVNDKKMTEVGFEELRNGLSLP